ADAELSHCYGEARSDGARGADLLAFAALRQVGSQGTFRMARTSTVNTPNIELFQVGSRLVLQARGAGGGVEPARGPLYRPLRIYTLDPSVSDRIGGVATVNVPYEKLEKGPVGALFDVRCDGAPRVLKAQPLDL